MYSSIGIDDADAVRGIHWRDSSDPVPTLEPGANPGVIVDVALALNLHDFVRLALFDDSPNPALKVDEEVLLSVEAAALLRDRLDLALRRIAARYPRATSVRSVDGQHES